MSEATNKENKTPQLHTAHSSDSGKKELVTQNTQEPVVERKKSDNPYEFTEDEIQMFGTHDMDTPIARAWSRHSRQHGHIGPPVAKQEEKDDHIRQDFRYATAFYPKHNNRNHTVYFHDARGEIGHQSGL